MFGLGFWEIAIVLAVVLVVLGPKGLPSFAKSMGRAMREFRRASNDLRRAVESETLDDGPYRDQPASDSSATSEDSDAPPDDYGANPAAPELTEGAGEDDELREKTQDAALVTAKLGDEKVKEAMRARLRTSRRGKAGTSSSALGKIELKRTATSAPEAEEAAAKEAAAKEAPAESAAAEEAAAQEEATEPPADAAQEEQRTTTQEVDPAMVEAAEVPADAPPEMEEKRTTTQEVDPAMVEAVAAAAEDGLAVAVADGDIEEVVDRKTPPPEGVPEAEAKPAQKPAVKKKAPAKKKAATKKKAPAKKKAAAADVKPKKKAPTKKKAASKAGSADGGDKPAKAAKKKAAPKKAAKKKAPAKKKAASKKKEDPTGS